MNRILTCIITGCLAAISIQAADTNVFSLKEGDRVALLGDGLLGREQLFGHVELLLTTHYPERNITFRNFGSGLDSSNQTVSAQPSPPATNLAQLKDVLLAFKPTVVILGSGQDYALGGVVGVTNLAADLTEVIKTLRSWFGPTNPPHLALIGMFRRDPPPAGFASVEAYEKTLAEMEKSLTELTQRERAHFVSLLEPMDNRAYLPAPPALADAAGRLSDYGYRRLAEAVALGFGWEPHFWQLGVLTGGAFRQGSLGAQFSDLVWQMTQVGVTIQEEQLPRAPWAPGEPSKFLRTPPIRLQFAGLASGNYLLKVDGTVIEQVSQAQCERGFRVVRSPQFDQSEQVRQAIRCKNELVFHRSHPKDPCPFPEHATSSGSQSSADLDRLIQAEEAKIARLRQPVKHLFEVVPAPTNAASLGTNSLSLPIPSKP